MNEKKTMMEIIPAMDIMDGKCVRLLHGDFSRQTIYHNEPAEVAKQFEDAGMKRLHLVDLDGAREGKVRNRKVLEQVSKQTSLIIDFGGGVKTKDDVQAVIDAGAGLVVAGTIAVKNENEFDSWIERFGAERFFLGADARNEMIAVSGWTEQTRVSLFDFIDTYVKKGIRQVFCTDISKDGALQGPAVELYSRIMMRFPQLHLTASGGVSQVQDLHDLQQAGCRGVIIGKALYEEKIRLKDLAEFTSQ